MKLLGMDAPIVLIWLIVGIVFGIASGKVAQKKGYSYSAFCALGFFLGVIGLIVALVMPDKAVKSVDIADGLLKYKRLLDEGVISQGEFDAKKKELMGEDS